MSHQKVHTRIAFERSLCGLAPKNGHYQIVSFSDFFIATNDDQCARCLERIEARGYKIEQLRLKYRTPSEVAPETVEA